MPEPVNAGRIHTLSPVLASQIAAGEVIERPASVVKELLENSLDAGATRIRIDIEAAGSRLIRVLDDGRGVHPDDLPLALAPHSTSKIQTATDLARIVSLGFRGEALASMAAVARVRMCSRQSDSAYEIKAEPGAVPATAAPAAHPPGTLVEVRDLFFNVPARRKFLRSAQTEFLHILELVRSFSLSRDNLGLLLRHNGRQAFNISAAAGALDRVGLVFGRAFATQSCHVEQAEDGLHISGLAGRPEAARSQADRQYVFLNGRLIRDRRLNHALRMAYTEHLPPGRYAPFVLYLEMDPATYDINVHPAKHEVRFRHMRQVHDFLYSAMRRALEDNRPAGHFVSAAPAGYSSGLTASVAERTPVYASAGAGLSATGEASVSVVDTVFGQPLGFIAGRYLLTDDRDGGWIIDYPLVVGQLAVARLHSALKSGPLASRPLLVPETAPATASVMAALERRQDDLKRLGIRLESAGPGEVLLRELPAQYPATDCGVLLKALLDWLQGGNPDSDADLSGVFDVLARCAAGTQPGPPAAAEQRLFLRELSEAQRQGWLSAPWPWRRLDAADLAALLKQH